MKAVFKGYKKAGCLEFTIGKIYELSTATEAFGFLKVTDDDGFNGVIIPGDTYDFEVLIPDEFINKKSNLNITLMAKWLLRQSSTIRYCVLRTLKEMALIHHQ
ncbi:virion structural protein [Escherichia virus ECH1]